MDWYRKWSCGWKYVRKDGDSKENGVIDEDRIENGIVDGDLIGR